jgi:hypothetical protein
MANPISRDPAEEGETGSVAGQPDQDLNRATDQNQAGNRGQRGSTDQRTDQDTDLDQMGSLGEGGVGGDMNYSGGAADTNTTPGYTEPYANPTDTGGAVPGASPGYGNVNPDYTGATDTPPADTLAAPGTMGKMTAPNENRGTMGDTGQTGAEDTMSSTGLSGAPSPADTSDTGLTGGMAPNERERMQSGMPDTPDTTGQGLTGDQGMAPSTRQGGV